VRIAVRYQGAMGTLVGLLILAAPGPWDAAAADSWRTR